MIKMTVPLQKLDPAENYINCHKNQLLAYLISHEFPAELLFYDCYECTDKIKYHFNNPGANRFNYRTNALKDADLHELPGFRYHSVPCGSADEVMDLMLAVLDKGIDVFVYGDLYYIPHRLDRYMTVHSHHSLMIRGETGLKSRNRLKVTDDVFDRVHFTFGRSYTDYEYPAETIRDFVAGDGTFKVIYFEKKQQRSSEELMMHYWSKSREWAQLSNDNFVLYENITGFMNIPYCTENEHLLRVIYGSRHFFRRFLMYVQQHYPAVNIAAERAVNGLGEIERCLEMIINLYLKYNISGKSSRQFQEHIHTLASLEATFLNELKKI